jgi:hypothetical protein
MSVPLRKVMAVESRHVGTSMSKRGTTIAVVNHYKTVFKLECGHCIIAPSSAPHVDAKRCKKCSSVSGGDS